MSLSYLFQQTVKLLEAYKALEEIQTKWIMISRNMQVILTADASGKDVLLQETPPKSHCLFKKALWVTLVTAPWLGCTPFGAAAQRIVTLWLSTSKTSQSLIESLAEGEPEVDQPTEEVSEEELSEGIPP